MEIPGTSTRGFTETEVTASQRNDFTIRRVIAGLCAKHPLLRRTPALLQIFQQQRLFISGTDDKDLLAILQCIINPRKESRIIVGFAGADGIGLVMQMFGRQVGTDRPLVDDIQSQIKDRGEPTR